MAKRVKVTARGSAQGAESYLRTGAGVRARRERLRALFPWIQRIVPPVLLAAAGLLFLNVVLAMVETEPQFRFPEDGRGLNITGLRFMDAGNVRRQFTADFGRPLLVVPLEARRKQLLELPWVKEASVLRVWPRQIWVDVTEQRPVAYVRVPSDEAKDTDELRLLVRSGIFLDPPEDVALDLPVVTGMSYEMALEERRVRVGLLERLLADLDRESPPYSGSLNEVDLSDDQNAVVTTMHQGQLVELQLGDRNFRHRYEIFLKYVDSWRQEFSAVRTVDLRFKGLVAVQ